MDISELKKSLRRVQLAIAKIEEGAQEYTIGNRRATRADLKTLYDREASLQNQIADAEGGGLCVTFADRGID